jgi:hypothetical protein
MATAVAAQAATQATRSATLVARERAAIRP